MSGNSVVSNSGSRAFHRKHRHGCNRCKERRVKCDMRRPKCSHCRRRNEGCLYFGEEETVSDSTPRRDPSKAVLLFHPYPSPELLGLIHQTPLDGSLLLLALEREVVNETHPATSREISLWRNALDVSDLAYYNFLWHSLSSLYLLHQGHVTTPLSRNYRITETAYRHHITASKLFNSTTPQVTKHNWLVFLGFGISIIVCQLAMQASCPDQLFDYVEMFMVMRASRDIDATSGKWLRASEIWSLIQERTMLTQGEKIDECGFWTALTLLESTLRLKGFVGEQGDCIFQAMQSLKNWVELCECRPRRWSHYIYWPATVPVGYVEMIKNGDGLALILMLHWLAIMRLGPPRWFMEGWLDRTAGKVLQQLSCEWDELTAWPASIVRTGRPEKLNKNNHSTIKCIPGTARGGAFLEDFEDF